MRESRPICSLDGVERGREGEGIGEFEDASISENSRNTSSGEKGRNECQTHFEVVK